MCMGRLKNAFDVDEQHGAILYDSGDLRDVSQDFDERDGLPYFETRYSGHDRRALEAWGIRTGVGVMYGNGSNYVLAYADDEGTMRILLDRLNQLSFEDAHTMPRAVHLCTPTENGFSNVLRDVFGKDVEIKTHSKRGDGVIVQDIAIGKRVQIFDE